jgi:aromatic ring-opening dioxygenase catalytic subunit (LigB family)
LIYDYYGFPENTYAPYFTYEAPTNLRVADRIAELLSQSGIPCEKIDRGFDHGVFIPLKLAFPDASVPIVQLSLKSNLDPAQHIALGEALKPLRSEGVLIITSGQATHNLQELFQRRSASSDLNRPEKWAVDFTDWLQMTLESLQTDNKEDIKESLIHFLSIAPGASRCHPRTEHIIPLFVAFGAAGNDEIVDRPQCRRLYQQIVMGSMSLDCYIFY